jgi:hypothetical protein
VLLLGQRVPVARRTALESVRDVDVCPCQPDAGEEPVEELSGLPDERNSLLILVEAGRLAHEHQVGVRMAVPEDDLRPGLAEDTACTARGFGPERIEHRAESLGERPDAHGFLAK